MKKGEVFNMRTATGTVAFNAPEIYMLTPADEDGYNEKIDIWSAGIVLYMMLCGH